ncbi:MAG TPA: hypothetical protein VLL82_15625 [Mycobacterium sp.]|nr:hypothetical protein [Mycobacterium sp.]
MNHKSALSLARSMAAHESWGKTPDRAARTANARRAADERFLAQADGDPLRAESLRKAHYKRIQLKSIAARKAKAAARQAELRTPGPKLWVSSVTMMI